ncbi:HNH endonuclease domain-containing protein [Proteinivorax hydrogeniformans]|uniref:HNH endonuclease domain-containing protein n=1 Tax=Proteinivorax hydrogeniformans TaxID=1826727 RepID=A0AAU8HR28_9FIRM
MVTLPQHEGINVGMLNQSIAFKQLTNSYKIYWLYAVFEEVIRGNRQIPFETLVCRMVAKNWFSSIQYKLNLGAQDKLYNLVTYIHQRYIPEVKIQEEHLHEQLVHLANTESDRDLHKKIRSLEQYVPYRLLSIFFSDELKGKKDYSKQKIIEELSNKDKKVLYSINSSKRYIVVNNPWFEYIRQNQSIIKGWLMYHLITFLQKRNPNVPAIPFKITPPAQRSLNQQTKFWKALLEAHSFKDIYTGASLNGANFSTYGNLSLDHFIPWSFVLHDEMWNLVPTFKNINSKKSDNLPSLDAYFDKFTSLQYDSITTAIKVGINSKILEDYLTINSSYNLKSSNVLLDKERFKKDLKSTIEPLYQIAENQGFQQWVF